MKLWNLRSYRIVYEWLVILNLLPHFHYCAHFNYKIKIIIIHIFYKYSLSNPFSSSFFSRIPITWFSLITVSWRHGEIAGKKKPHEIHRKKTRITEKRRDSPITADFRPEQNHDRKVKTPDGSDWVISRRRCGLGACCNIYQAPATLMATRLWL